MLHNRGFSYNERHLLSLWVCNSRSTQQYNPSSTERTFTRSKVPHWLRTSSAAHLLATVQKLYAFGTLSLPPAILYFTRKVIKRIVLELLELGAPHPRDRGFAVCHLSSPSPIDPQDHKIASDRI